MARRRLGGGHHHGRRERTARRPRGRRHPRNPKRGNLVAGRGPRLLVIDEYQMLADAHRGANYELALALAPPDTQLLLLSGSVGNPGDVAAWLRRLGRDVELVVHRERPVPLEESALDTLPFHVDPRSLGGGGGGRLGGGKLLAPARSPRPLLADLGPILVFAPRRAAAEDLARTLASALPVDDPLVAFPGADRFWPARRWPGCCANGWPIITAACPTPRAPG